MTKYELCEEGQRLWEAIDHRKPNSYDDYRRHIIRCRKCQDGLDLSRRDLLIIRDDMSCMRITND